MNFNNKIPIYLQLYDHYQKMILSGELAPGMVIPSVRKVAFKVHINANTVQHAMVFLMHEGLVESHKGKGYSVIKNQQTIIYQRQKLVQHTTIQFLHIMKELGYNRQQIIEAISQYSHGDES